MTTYTLDRSTYRTVRGLAGRIRQLMADGGAVEVCDRKRLAYRVEPMPSASSDGPAFLLYTADGFSIGTFADVEALVRYADALPRPVMAAKRRQA